jgi:hypothetical protein
MLLPSQRPPVLRSPVDNIRAGNSDGVKPAHAKLEFEAKGATGEKLLAFKVKNAGGGWTKLPYECTG